MADILLLGSNLAVLVAAEAAALAGDHVELWTDGGALGGHFRGVVASGHTFDAGSVVLEPHSTAGPPPALASYDPSVRHDWTRFGRLVTQWLEEHVALREAAAGETLVGDERWPDHLAGDDLSVVAAEGRGPTPCLDPDDPRHPRWKVAGRAYDQLLYDDAGVLCHGPLVHRALIAGYGRKVVGDLYDGLLARYHRSAWLPLFWPESIAAARGAERPAVATRRYWSSKDGSFAHAVRQLEVRVREHPSVHVVEERVARARHGRGGWAISSGERTSTAEHIGVGLTASRFSQLLGVEGGPAEEAAPLTIGLLLVRGAAITTPLGSLTCPDASMRAFRIADQDHAVGRDPEWHRVTAEVGPAAGAGGPDTESALAADVRRALGVQAADDVRTARMLSLPRGPGLPTVSGVAAYQARAASTAERAPGVVGSAGLLGVAVGSLNDQVVQGLRMAQELRG